MCVIQIEKGNTKKIISIKPGVTQAVVMGSADVKSLRNQQVTITGVDKRKPNPADHTFSVRTRENNKQGVVLISQCKIRK